LGKFGRVGDSAEKLGGFCALGVFDLLEVKESDRGTCCDQPVTVVLRRSQISSLSVDQMGVQRTSLDATGFSNRVR
jgi:hypothetical protein